MVRDHRWRVSYLQEHQTHVLHLYVHIMRFMTYFNLSHFSLSKVRRWCNGAMRWVDCSSVSSRQRMSPWLRSQRRISKIQLLIIITIWVLLKRNYRCSSSAITEVKQTCSLGLRFFFFITIFAYYVCISTMSKAKQNQKSSNLFHLLLDVSTQFSTKFSKFFTTFLSKIKQSSTTYTWRVGK